MDNTCAVDPSVPCKGLHAVGILEHRVVALEQGLAKDREAHTDFRRLYYQDREARIRRDAELDGMFESVEARLQGMDAKLDTIAQWQETQKEKPAKRIEAVVDKVILLVVTALVGYLLMRVGL